MSGLELSDKCVECGRPMESYRKTCKQCGCPRGGRVKNAPPKAAAPEACPQCGEARPGHLRLCRECQKKKPRLKIPSPERISRPINAYKAILDTLVQETSSSVSAGQVPSGRFSKAPGYEALNEFVQSLSAQQRLLLADMLQAEREYAIHDVLALLTWWIECHNVALTYRGKPMLTGESAPIGLSEMGLHGDYVGRLDNWEWPKGE